MQWVVLFNVVGGKRVYVRPVEHAFEYNSKVTPKEAGG